MSNLKTIAIFPGSFDPPHLGHLDVLMQATKTFDHVIWAILTNTSKTPLFSPTVRMEMMMTAVAGFPNIEIRMFPDVLLVDAAKELRATHIVRSLRVGMDFDHEFPMTLINRKLDPELITVYFPAQQEHFHISSSIVRELLKFKRSVSDLVPKYILPIIKHSGHQF